MSETRDDLREALVACLEENDGVWSRLLADSLLSGPLAPILAQVSALQAKVERLQKDKRELAMEHVARDLGDESHFEAVQKMGAEIERLNSLLAPFVAYAKAHQRSMWGSGEIGGVIGPDGLRCAIRDSDLMALLEAPSTPSLTETKEGSESV